MKDERDALRAENDVHRRLAEERAQEIERLTHDRDGWAQTADRYAARYEQAEAENERLRAVPMTEMPGPNETRLNLIDGVEYITLRADDFRAEFARLKHLHDLDHSLADQREAKIERLERRFREAEAEWVERFEQLRAALEKIANTEGNIHPSWHVETAREALGREGGLA